MYNLYSHIANNPARCERLTCGEALFTMFNCGLRNKFEDLWSHHNYIIYVVDGKKVWHTSHGAYDLQTGSCVFVRKGACIVEQFIEAEFCFFLFFVPDEFICEVLRSKNSPLKPGKGIPDPVMNINGSPTIHSFFQSMLPYFDAVNAPDQSLVELKFRELILAIADNPENEELLSWFCTLLKEPQSITLQRVMEENFSYNLKLEDYARLSTRSLSAFKRDFNRLYQESPGKWLLEKRLNHAWYLLINLGKTVSDASFESGFESTAHFSRAFRKRFAVSPGQLRSSVLV